MRQAAEWRVPTLSAVRVARYDPQAGDEAVRMAAKHEKEAEAAKDDRERFEALTARLARATSDRERAELRALVDEAAASHERHAAESNAWLDRYEALVRRR